MLHIRERKHEWRQFFISKHPSEARKRGKVVHTASEHTQMEVGWIIYSDSAQDAIN